MSTDAATAVAKKGPIDEIAERFADVRVRTLLFAGLGALAMIFATLFLNDGAVGGFLVLVLGAAGLALGWRAAPAGVVLILFYFLLFPDGIPDPVEYPTELADGHFRVPDLMLVAAVVVYLSAHYRLYGLTTQAFAADEVGKKAAPRKRPADLVRTGELARLFYLTAAVVVVGQVVWAVVTNLEVDVTGDFPFRFTDAPAYVRDPGDLKAWQTRTVAVLGLVFFGTLLARLVFGYWRLRTLTPAEGAMLLADGGWDETRRERVRVEAWRTWAARRVADLVRTGKAGPRRKR